ncbi:MAG: hypothetical protein FOGNACKC_02491 [Anaerolineae bacterium]|nr:hypothetical protein [Anaerolineae bacterium]
MDVLMAALMVTAMFVVRLGIPIAITLAVGYWLRQLDARWQAEALARQANALAEKEAGSEREIEILKVIDPPCWVTNNCPQAKREGCPACRLNDIPCWLARFRMEGRLPAKCYNCQLFAPRRHPLPFAANKVSEV